MSVIDPVIDSIDSENRLIYLAVGVREYHPIDDLYKEIRNLRRLNEDLRKYDIPIKAEGSLPKGGGKYTPRYAIFRNGWQVVPEDVSHSLFVNGEQITDDGQSGPACINTDVLSAGVSVIIQYQPPAAELIKAEDELVAIQRMAFDEVITVNQDTGVDGTEWPVGTLGRPVRTMEDALIISANQNIPTLSIAQNVTLGSENYNGLSFIGASKTKTVITIPEEAEVVGCDFSHAKLSGTLDGDTRLSECIISSLLQVSGFIEDSILQESSTIVLANSGPTHFVNCSSGATQANAPVIDMGGSGSSVIMKNYNGPVSFINKTGPENISIDLSSGQIAIDLATVTAGEITIGGIGKVVDTGNGEHIPSGVYGDLTVHNNTVSHATIAEGVWDEQISKHLEDGTTGHSVGASQFGGKVHLHPDGGSGVDFPMGTSNVPVNNLTDALAIARSNGIFQFYVPVDFTVKSTDVIDNMVFIGGGSASTKITFEPGCITANCQAKDCTLTGMSLGLVLMQNCRIQDYGGSGVVASDKTILLKNSAIEGNLNIPSNYTGILRVVDCYSIHSPVQGPPTVNFNGGAFMSLVESFTGELAIENCTHEDSTTSVDLLSGTLTLADTVTHGTFNVRGVGLIEDLSGPDATVNMWGLLNNQGISDATWANTIAQQIVSNIDFIKEINGGKWEIVGNQMIFYKEDNTTEIARLNLFDSSGTPTMTNVMSRERV